MVWLVEEEKTTRVRVYLWWPSTSSSAWMAYRCFCLVVYWKNEWMVPGERSSSLLFNVRESRRRRSLVPPSLNYNILGVAFKFKQNNHKSLRALFSPECMFNCYSTSSLEGNSKTRALLMTTCWFLYSSNPTQSNLPFRADTFTFTFIAQLKE